MWKLQPLVVYSTSCIGFSGIVNNNYYMFVDLQFILIRIVLAVQFSRANYFGLETIGIVAVNLLLEGGTSTNDITVTVIPSDRSPVSAEGK